MDVGGRCEVTAEMGKRESGIKQFRILPPPPFLQSQIESESLWPFLFEAPGAKTHKPRDHHHYDEAGLPLGQQLLRA